MKEVSICPHCGYDIEPDSPILINDFSMAGAGYPLFYRGIKVDMTHGETLVCWTLMKAYPDFVTTGVLLERLGNELDNAALIRVHISRIRKKLRGIDAPPSIVTVKGHHAYIWDPRGGEDEEIIAPIAA